MKANELRIGNLIYRKGGSEIFLDGRPEIKHPDIVVEVKTIFSDNGIDGVNASWNGDRYVFDPPLWNAKPIPLTEEWLVRAGFEIVKRIYQHPLDRSDYTLMSFKFKNFEAKRYHYVATGEDTHGWEFKCYDKMIPIWIGVTDYVY